MRIELDLHVIESVEHLVESVALDITHRNELRQVILQQVNLAVHRNIASETHQLKDIVSARWGEHRQLEETPPEFIERVYGRWLGRGLTRAQILGVDPQLYRALYNWANRHGMPPQLDLPTQREVSAAAIAQATGSLSSAPMPTTTAPDAHSRKLLNALRYQALKDKQERSR